MFGYYFEYPLVTDYKISNFNLTVDNYPVPLLP